jgi:hypothetical protein
MGQFYQAAQAAQLAGVNEALLFEDYEEETQAPETATQAPPIQNNTVPTDDQEAALTRKQLAQLQLKNADPETKQKAKEEIAKADKLDPCSSVANQGETAAGNALATNLLTTATQTAYGDATPVSDEQQTARFEKLVNPELERMGIPPVHEYANEKLYRMSTEERAQFIDVFDPVKKEVSVAPTQEVEDQRFEEFIKEEMERTGMSENEVRAIVNRVKKENHEMDQEHSQSNEAKSYKFESFKNFMHKWHSNQ